MTDVDGELARIEQLGDHFEAALVQLEDGASLRRDGRRQEAADRLRCAVSTFSLLRATPFLERARRELAECGPSPVGSTRDVSATAA